MQIDDKMADMLTELFETVFIERSPREREWAKERTNRRRKKGESRGGGPPIIF